MSRRWTSGLVRFLALSSLANIAIADDTAQTPEAWFAFGAVRPVGGDFATYWQTGFAFGTGLRVQFAPRVKAGFQFALHFHPADDSNDPRLSMLAMTTETDLFFREERENARPSVRPFVNAGLGYYHTRLDDSTTQPAVPDTRPVQPEEFEGGAFGLHGGGGIEFDASHRLALRLDATYHHLFRGGQDIGDVPLRLCAIWR